MCLYDEEAYIKLLYHADLCSLELKKKFSAEFRAILAKPGVQSTTAIDESGRPLGFVVTAFLKPKFEKHLRNSLEPDIVPKIIYSDAVIASDHELGKVNGSGQLVSTVLSFGYMPNLDLNCSAIVKHELMDRAVNSFIGFNLAEIMIEAHSEAVMIELLKGGFTKVNTYDEWWEKNHGTRQTCPALMTVNRRAAQQGADFHILRMFVFSEPKYLFSLPERTLLDEALGGLTDKELSLKLSIGVDAVKGRWKSIYAKTEDRFVDVIEEDSNKTRSKEKRRKVIDYVRLHPEELRPYKPVSLPISEVAHQ